jgi:hypothetical protein
VFERESPEAVFAAVADHEKKNECQRPIYDGLKGRFLTDEEIAGLRAVKA